MLYIFFFKQKTAYEMRISDWSSDVCSSDLCAAVLPPGVVARHRRHVRAAAPCRTGARNGVGAAGREAERRAGRAMGPDLEMRSRRGVGGPARRDADAFCRRADQRARKSAVSGKGECVRGDIGGGRCITKKTYQKKKEKI